MARVPCAVRDYCRDEKGLASQQERWASQTPYGEVRSLSRREDAHNYRDDGHDEEQL